VYLPAGSRWTDYWTGATFTGGQTITRQTPLSVMPIYIKSDSLIPTRDIQQYWDEKPLTNLILDGVVDGTASTTFYEDDGWTLDYQQGEYNETKFTATRQGNGRVTFTQDVVTDGFDTKLQTVTWKLRDVPRPPVVQGQANARSAVAAPEISYDPANQVATVTVPVAAGPVTITY
jgi:alpha-glucosidase